MKTALITLVLALVSWSGIAADTPKTTDQSDIQGMWLAQSASANGFKVEEAAGCQYAFHGDQLTIRDANGKEMRYSFRLDTTNSPKLFVLQPEQTLTNATVCSVAYELSGDSLKIAMASPGSRPTDISDKNNQMLIVLKRKRP